VAHPRQQRQARVHGRAHNSTLESIASLRPSSLAELGGIKSIGPGFVERHGELVLEIVAAG
jgi:hypothetical protein